jgi:hypothetical protein
MRGLTNFPGIFAILFDFLIDVETRDRYRASPRSTATPPCVRLMPAPHSLTLGPRPHHLGLLARPFHGIHEVLQRVRFASDDSPALPFDWIQSHLARVNLDRRTSSAARTPAVSRLYLARRRCRDIHIRSNSVLPMHLRMILILKILYSHFKLTSRRRTTSYHASQSAVIILR